MYLLKSHKNVDCLYCTHSFNNHLTPKNVSFVQFSLKKTHTTQWKTNLNRKPILTHSICVFLLLVIQICSHRSVCVCVCERRHGSAMNPNEIRFFRYYLLQFLLYVAMHGAHHLSFVCYLLSERRIRMCNSNVIPTAWWAEPWWAHLKRI